GQLKHADSMQHGSVIHAGQWQRMTAGTGVFHSEFNPSQNEPVHLYQIWIKPDERGLEPEYEEKRPEDAQGRLQLIASPDGAQGSMKIHQDAKLFHGRFEGGQQVTRELVSGRYAWLQVLQGNINVNGETLQTG